MVSPEPAPKVQVVVAPKVQRAPLVKVRPRRRRRRSPHPTRVRAQRSPAPSAVPAINKGIEEPSAQGGIEVPTQVAVAPTSVASQDDGAPDEVSPSEHVEGPSRPTAIDIGAIQSTALRAVQRAKYYPRAARRLGQEGTVIVIVYLAPNGDLARAPEVYRSSRFAALDEAALLMVQRAAPLPLPAGVQLVANLRFAIPIHFKLLDESYGASL